jgi:hypothetical protein
MMFSVTLPVSDARVYRALLRKGSLRLMIR